MIVARIVISDYNDGGLGALSKHSPLPSSHCSKVQYVIRILCADWLIAVCLSRSLS